MPDWTTIQTLLVLIPALPLAATVATAVLGPRVLRAWSHLPIVAALVIACALSLALLREVNRAAADSKEIGYETTIDLWTWADVPRALEAVDSADDDPQPTPSPIGSNQTQRPATHWGAAAPAVAPTAVAATGETLLSSHQPPDTNHQPSTTSRPFNIAVTLRADGLTCMMLAMVTFVASLIAIYAAGYMHGDRGYWRFFTYIGLFVFSMTMLVAVSNFVLLYVFWEAVGLCSYLLIGFWYEKPEAAAAGKKAFLVNRVGDFGFALGLFLIWTTYGTLNFHDADGVPGVLGQTRLAAESGQWAVGSGQERGESDQGTGESDQGTGDRRQGGTPPRGQNDVFRLASHVNPQSAIRIPQSYVGGGVGLAICLLLLLGACGKSAQFPLHVWLPDAMEGPTPVSALIHAATMVTAGVYMVARCTPLFAVDCAPYIDAPVIVAVVGGFTALLAGIIALTQNDLKRVLAYSTISQLGYMFLALGTGSVVGILAGMFHLFTHAFFKALLFLGAGSVMHAMGGVIDIRKFGGLRRLMPWTFWTFLAGSLALAGVWPLAGFFSKDAVIASVYELGIGDGPYAMAFQWLTYVAFFTAFLTSVYTFRAFWMTFYGEEQIPPEAGHHAHESPAVMTVPLVVLAICAMFVGWAFGQPGDLNHGFASVVASAPSLAVMAERVDVADNKLPAATAEHGAKEHAGAEAAHVDHERIHGRVATISLSLALLGIGISAFLFQGDRREVNALARLPVFKQLYELSYGKFFFDQIYTLLVVWPGLVLAKICYFLDRYFVDGLVNAVGRLPGAVGRVLRGMQAGMIGLYALLMLLGLLTLLGSAVWQTW